MKRKQTATIRVAKPVRQGPTDSEIGAQQSQRKHVWTREAIIHELATWLASGTTIDAAFVSRHGPPGPPVSAEPGAIDVRSISQYRQEPAQFAKFVRSKSPWVLTNAQLQLRVR